VSAAGKSRLARLALWGAVAGAAVGGVGGLVRGGGGAATAAPTSAPSAVGPAGFAELVVAGYLPGGRGQEDRLRPLISGLPSLDQVEPGQWAVDSTAAVGAELVRPGYWSVTVAAAVRPTGVKTAGQVRYYRLGVIEGERAGAAAYTAIGVPMQVPAPLGVAAPQLAYAASPLPDSDPVAATVQQFLTALLAGGGDVSRYVAPGVDVEPVLPAPFRAVKVVDLRRGVGPVTAGRVSVLATIVGGDDAGREQQLMYPLDLAEREGRWEVTALVPAAHTEVP